MCTTYRFKCINVSISIVNKPETPQFSIAIILTWKITFFVNKTNVFQNTNASENADIDFQYNDTDSHPNEIAELYSYTEQSEFQLNVKAFDELMESFKIQPSWQKLSDVTRRSVVLKLLDHLELSDQAARMKSARCILYLAQVCTIDETTVKMVIT